VYCREQWIKRGKVWRSRSSWQGRERRRAEADLTLRPPDESFLGHHGFVQAFEYFDKHITSGWIKFGLGLDASHT